jgi:hypothetical protein
MLCDQEEGGFNMSAYLVVDTKISNPEVYEEHPLINKHILLENAEFE